MKYAAETQVTEVCKNLNQNNYCYGNHCCSFWPDSRRMQQQVSCLYLPTQRVLKFYCWPGEGEKVLPSNCTVEESKIKNKKRTFTAITKAILSTNNMPLFNHHWYWTLAADKQINWNIPVALVHVNALLGIRTCVCLFFLNQPAVIDTKQKTRQATVIVIINN